MTKPLWKIYKNKESNISGIEGLLRAKYDSEMQWSPSEEAALFNISYLVATGVTCCRKSPNCNCYIWTDPHSGITFRTLGIENNEGEREVIVSRACKWKDINQEGEDDA